MNNMYSYLYEAWERLFEDGFNDGLVCDIVIQNTSIREWEEFILFVTSNYAYKYGSEKGAEDIPLNSFGVFFRNEKSRILTIGIGDFTIECAILAEDRIELTAFPLTIPDENQLELLFDFISKAGIILKKEITISLEGLEKPAFVFSPTEKIFRISYKSV